ncbi:unnamed protein product, partial [Mesorhabditis spiculigera]
MALNQSLVESFHSDFASDPEIRKLIEFRLKREESFDTFAKEDQQLATEFFEARRKLTNKEVQLHAGQRTVEELEILKAKKFSTTHELDIAAHIEREELKDKLRRARISLGEDLADFNRAKNEVLRAMQKRTAIRKQLNDFITATMMPEPEKTQEAQS